MLRAVSIARVAAQSEQQKYLAPGFACSSEAQERFCDASYHFAATEALILDAGLAFIDARVVAEYPGSIMLSSWMSSRHEGR